MIFMLPFGGWQDIVSVMGDMYLLIYAASAVAVAVFRAEPGGRTARNGVPGVRWIAPLSFVVASEFVYWSGWHDLRLALPLVLGGLLIFLAMRRRGARDKAAVESDGAGPSRPLGAELRTGAWLVVYLDRADGALVAGHLRGLRPAAGAVRLDHRGRPRARGLLLGRAVRRPASGGGPPRGRLNAAAGAATER